jgi:hypothetical protein
MRQAIITALMCALFSACNSSPREVSPERLQSALLQRTNGGIQACAFTSVGPQKAIDKRTVSVPYEASCTITSKYLDPDTFKISGEFKFRYIEGTPGFFSGTPPGWELPAR